MKIKYLLLFLFIVNVLEMIQGQVSPTSTVSISMSNSVSMSLSNSVSMSLSNSVSMSLSNSVSMSLSNTISSSISPSNSITATNSWSNTVSNSLSYTFTPTTSTLQYLPPINVINSCINQTREACFSWSRSVGAVTYDTFDIRYYIIYDTFNSITNVFGLRTNNYVITDLQPGTNYEFEVRGNSLSTGMTSAYTRYFFSTGPTYRNGVANIICYIIPQRSTVECGWTNGVNLYSKIKAALYCPYASKVMLSRIRAKSPADALVLVSVPSGSTICRVSFAIKYNKFSTQKWNSTATINTP